MSSEPLSARGVTAQFLRRDDFSWRAFGLRRAKFTGLVYTVAEQRRDFTDLPRFKLGLIDSSTRTGMRLHRACGWVKWVWGLVQARANHQIWLYQELFLFTSMTGRIARLTPIWTQRRLSE